MKQKISTRPGRGKGITIEMSEEDRKRFKALANSVGLDMSKLLRQMVKEYLSKDHAAVQRSVDDIRATELTASIMRALTEFAVTHREQNAFLAGMDGVLGFGVNSGTLASLAKDVTKL